MLCVHTVRRLKPGTFADFAGVFRPGGEAPRPGWMRFNLLRGMTDENEVITFGIFDGTLEELHASQSAEGYDRRMDTIEPFVDEVISSGIYEVVLDVDERGSCSGASGS